MKKEENTSLYLYLRLLNFNKGNIKTLNIFIFAKTKFLPLSLFLSKYEPTVSTVVSSGYCFQVDCIAQKQMIQKVKMWYIGQSLGEFIFFKAQIFGFVLTDREIRVIKAKNKSLWGNPFLQPSSQTVSPCSPLSQNLSPLQLFAHFGATISWRICSWWCSCRTVLLPSRCCSQAFMLLTYFKHLLNFRALAVFVKLQDGQTDSHFSFMFSLWPFKIFSAWEESKEGEKTLLHILLGSVL